MAHFDERKTFRLSIIASIAASLFVLYFIQPGLDFIWNISLRIGDRALSFFTDSLYVNASYGDRNWIISIFAILLITVPPIFLFLQLIIKNLLNRFLGYDDDAELDNKTSAELNIIRRKKIVLLFISTIIYVFSAFYLVVFCVLRLTTQH